MVVCHALPILFAILFGLFLIEETGSRDDPRAVERIFIEPGTAKPGDVIQVHVVVEDIRKCGGTVNLTLLDSKGIQYDIGVNLPVYTTNITPVGERFEFVRTITLPPKINPGLVTYFADRQRWCNWFQHYFWPIRDFSSTAFTIVAQ